MIDNRREDSASLAEYVAILWRRRLTVLAAVVGVPIVAVVLSSMLPAEHTASADVLLRTENLAATLSGVPDHTGRDPERLLDTQSKLARTPPVARTAAKLAGSEISSSDFLGASSVSVDPSADILTFSATAATPAQAIRRANAYAQAYTRYRTSLDLGPVRQALATVNARIRKLRVDGTTDLPLYSSLLERQQELESLRALRSQSAVVVDPAQDAPQTQPRLRRAAMLGVIVGIFLGIGVALLRNALENRPRSTDELQRQLDLHLLGRIPSSPEGATSLVTIAHPRSVDAEAYRLLRMNFEYAAGASEGTMFVVTSTVAEEGKSTVAANLAVALARVGRSVILVDSDPLRPVVGERFRIRSSTPDLSDVVTGRASLESALALFALPGISGDVARPFAKVDEGDTGDVRTRLVPVLRPGEVRELSPSTPRSGSVDGGSLRVLVSRPTSVELSDYLVATKMETLLTQLRHHAEIVILDAPPLTTSVGMGVARLADGVIVVANVRMMRRPMLDQLSGMLEELATPKLGLVLTGLSVDETATYGYHYPVAKPATEALLPVPSATVAEGRWSSAS